MKIDNIITKVKGLQENMNKVVIKILQTVVDLLTTLYILQLPIWISCSVYVPKNYESWLAV